MFKYLTKVLTGSPAPTASLEDCSWGMIDEMAEQMPAREGVWWGVCSGREVADKLSPEDLAALDAAEAWVKDPSEETVEGIKNTLEGAPYQGPGAWTALAAMSVPVETALAGGGPTGLAAKAIAGAVKMAASIAMEDAPDLPETASPPDVGDVPEVEPVTEAADDPAAAVAEALAGPAPSESELSETAEAIKPFIDKGKQIQEGGDSWA